MNEYEIGSLVVGKIVSEPKTDNVDRTFCEIEVWGQTQINPDLGAIRREGKIFGLVVGFLVSLVVMLIVGDLLLWF